MGFNPEAARYSGMSVGKNYILVMAVCGLFAGLAGAIDVLGWQFRIATNDLPIVYFGFIGIAVALLGRNTAIGTVAAALLFGALYSGTSQRNLDPTIFEPSLASNLTFIIQGLVILIVSADVLVLAMHETRARAVQAPAGARGRDRGAGAMSASTVAASRVGVSARTAAWAGIVLGVLAAYVALPPLLIRTSRSVAAARRRWAFPPVSMPPARASGGSAGSRSASRCSGAILAVMAVKSGESNLERVFVWSALTAGMLRFATPLIFGAMGGILSERSGVINIGLEGMMLTGAFFGIFGADITGSWFLGILVGVAAGALMGLVHAFVSIQLRADQVVSGTGINIIALGITGYVFIYHYGDQGTPSDISRVPNVTLPRDPGHLVRRRGDRQLEPAHLGRAAARPAADPVPVPDARRPPAALDR